MSAALPIPRRSPAEVVARASLLRRLEVDVRRKLDGLLTGDHPGIGTAPGSEPAGARLYAPGDDARRIDWNLSARSLDAHVRTTEPDRELETLVVVDRSASLDFGTTQHEKREVVVGVLAAFGFLATGTGNRVNVLVAGGESLVPLRGRPGQLGSMAAVAAVHDTSRRPDGPSPTADLASALRSVVRTMSRRGLVVIASDFLDPTGWEGPLRRLCLRHQVIAVQISDPRELELPDVGLLAVIDVETGRRLHVPTGDARLRRRYREAAAGRQAAIRERIRAAGAEHLELSTSSDWLRDIATFIQTRRRTGARALPRGRIR
jgi:uncharacterized protein (DUF58 family)